jgi:hypothetical protein
VCGLICGRSARNWRRSASVHLVNEMRALSFPIRAANVSGMKIVYVWGFMCVHNLSPIQSLRERRSGGRESIRGPQQLGLCEGSVYCQGVRLDCGPPSFLVTLRGSDFERIWHSLKSQLHVHISSTTYLTTSHQKI